MIGSMMHIPGLTDPAAPASGPNFKKTHRGVRGGRGKSKGAIVAIATPIAGTSAPSVPSTPAGPTAHVVGHLANAQKAMPNVTEMRKHLFRALTASKGGNTPAPTQAEAGQPGPAGGIGGMIPGTRAAVL
jgi:hypothetical protein